MSTKIEGQEDVEAGASLPPKRPSKLVLIIGLVALIITAQAVITYLLIPKAAATPKDPAAGDKQAAGASGAPVEEVPDVRVANSAEVSLGDFNCTNSTAAPGVVIHVDFKLYAVTTSQQASQLEQQVKSHQARVRQIVNKIVRSSSLEDLNDPNLGTIKRLVREEINRLLQKSLISEVVISDIRTMEQ